MTDAFSRSTWAYATFLFVVLFSPQIVRDHVAGADRVWSLFPNVITLLAMLVVLFLAVRQGMSGEAAGAIGAGIARGCAVACTGAVLYGIGVVMLGPTVFTDSGFTWMAALISVVAIAVLGSGASVAMAYLLRRRAAAR